MAWSIFHFLEQRSSCIGKMKKSEACFSRSPEKVGRNNHVFFDRFKFYWVTLKLLGMFPYHFDKEGNLLFSLCSKEMFYSVVMYGVLSVPAFFSLLHRYENRHLILGNFDRLIYSCLMICLMVPHFVVPASQWVEIKRCQRIFKAWREFQKRYEEAFNEKLVLRTRWRSQRCLLLVLSCSIIICFLNFFMVKVHRRWEIGVYTYVLAIFLLFKMAFVSQCCSLMVIARDLRSKVLEAIAAENPKLISKYSVVWIHLEEVTGHVGNIFYRMYGHLLIMIFAASTIIVYYVLKAFLSPVAVEVRILGFPLATVMLTNVWIYFVCECGERLALEVGYKFTTRLSRARAMVNNLETREEVDSFINTIQSLPPAVTLNKFATVNRQLFVRVYSTMLTYLVVLMQFSHEFMGSSSFFQEEINNRFDNTSINK